MHNSANVISGELCSVSETRRRPKLQQKKSSSFHRTRLYFRWAERPSAFGRSGIRLGWFFCYFGKGRAEGTTKHSSAFRRYDKNIHRRPKLQLFFAFLQIISPNKMKIPIFSCKSHQNILSLYSKNLCHYYEKTMSLLYHYSDITMKLVCD